MNGRVRTVFTKLRRKATTYAPKCEFFSSLSIKTIKPNKIDIDPKRLVKSCKLSNRIMTMITTDEPYVINSSQFLIDKK